MLPKHSQRAVIPRWLSEAFVQSGMRSAQSPAEAACEQHPESPWIAPGQLADALAIILTNAKPPPGQRKAYEALSKLAVARNEPFAASRASNELSARAILSFRFSSLIAVIFSSDHPPPGGPES